MRRRAKAFVLLLGLGLSLSLGASGVLAHHCVQELAQVLREAAPGGGLAGMGSALGEALRALINDDTPFPAC